MSYPVPDGRLPKSSPAHIRRPPIVPTDTQHPLARGPEPAGYSTPFQPSLQLQYPLPVQAVEGPRFFYRLKSCGFVQAREGSLFFYRFKARRFVQARDVQGFFFTDSKTIYSQSRCLAVPHLHTPTSLYQLHTTQESTDLTSTGEPMRY